MKKISVILGKDSSEYESLHKLITDAINKKWYNRKSGSYSIGSQGSNAFALWADAVPHAQKDVIASEMARHIKEDCDGHLDTGIFGTLVLLDFLVEYGFAGIALGTLQKRSYPSFGHMLERGATTLWERFEGHESRNHPMFGGYTAWLYKYAAGISASWEQPGYKKIVFTPKLFDFLDFASSKIQTDWGEISINWSKVNSDITINIATPILCTADVIMPEGYLIDFSEGLKWRIQEAKKLVGYGVVTKVVSSNVRKN
jgi:alpha-L-rhamnosidase